MRRGEYTPTANGGRYEHWTRDRDRTLRELFAAGKSDSEIAAALQTTASRVGHRRHLLKLSRRVSVRPTAHNGTSASGVAQITIEGPGMRVQRTVSIEEAMTLAALVLGGDR